MLFDQKLNTEWSKIKIHNFVLKKIIKLCNFWIALFVPIPALQFFQYQQNVFSSPFSFSSLQITKLSGYRLLSEKLKIHQQLYILVISKEVLKITAWIYFHCQIENFISFLFNRPTQNFSNCFKNFVWPWNSLSTNKRRCQYKLNC